MLHPGKHAVTRSADTAVRSAGGPALDRRRLVLPGHIKSVGAYQVQVKLHPEVTAKFDVTVSAAK